MRFLSALFLATIAFSASAQAASSCPIAPACRVTSPGNSCSCPKGTDSHSFNVQVISTNNKLNINKTHPNVVKGMIAERIKLAARHRGRFYTRCIANNVTRRHAGLVRIRSKTWRVNFLVTMRCMWHTKRTCQVRKSTLMRRKTGRAEYRFGSPHSTTRCQKRPYELQLKRKYGCNSIRWLSTRFTKQHIGNSRQTNRGGQCLVQYIIQCVTPRQHTCCSCSGR